MTVPNPSQPRWVGDIWIFAAIVLSFLALTRWQYPDHKRFVTIKRGEVVYTINSNQAIALRLANAMEKVREFNGTHKTVRLDYKDGRHQMFLVVPKELAASRPAAMAQLRTGIRALCTEVFEAEPVSVWLTDRYLKPHTELERLPK